MSAPLDFAGFAARAEVAQNEPVMVAAGDRTPLATYRFGPEDAAETVLIYHGGGANAAAGYAQLAGMVAGDDLAVWAVDMRGHGASGGRRGHTPRPGRVWDDVNAVMAACGSSRVHLVGHSSGAGMLLNAYAGLTRSVAGMYFIAPQFGFRAGLEVEGSKGRFATASIPAFIASSMTLGVLGGLTAVRFNYDGAARADELGLVRTYTVHMANAVTPARPAAQLAAVDVPVWVAVAGRDEAIDAGKLTRFVEAHGVTVCTLAESGHLDAILDAAGPLRAAVLEAAA